MAGETKDDENDAQINITPSTASHVRPGIVENAFPTPPKRDAFLSSPSRAAGRVSPAMKSLLGMHRAASTPPENTKDSFLNMSQRSRGHMNGLPKISDLEASWQKQSLSKRTSQFFDKALTIRENPSTARERVHRDSMIVADIKLNSCLEKEQDFLVDFSYRLSEIYQRSISSIAVLVSTDCHIMLSGSSDPAYLLTVAALNSEIAPTKNKRSTAMIQDFLGEALTIPASRGLLRFDELPEHGFATNSSTYTQEIERLERKSYEESRSMYVTSRQAHRTNKKSNLPYASEVDDISDSYARARTPAITHEHSADSVPTRASGTRPSTGRKVKNRKSLMYFLTMGRAERQKDAEASQQA